MAEKPSIFSPRPYNEIDWIQINIGVLAKFISWLRTRKNEKNIIDLSQLRIERHNSSIK
jgi:hypothetical protein